MLLKTSLPWGTKPMEGQERREIGGSKKKKERERGIDSYEDQQKSATENKRGGWERGNSVREVNFEMDAGREKGTRDVDVLVSIRGRGEKRKGGKGVQKIRANRIPNKKGLLCEILKGVGYLGPARKEKGSGKKNGGANGLPNRGGKESRGFLLSLPGGRFINGEGKTVLPAEKEAPRRSRK